MFFLTKKDATFEASGRCQGPQEPISSPASLTVKNSCVIRKATCKNLNKDVNEPRYVCQKTR